MRWVKTFRSNFWPCVHGRATAWLPNVISKGVFFSPVTRRIFYGPPAASA